MEWRYLMAGATWLAGLLGALLLVPTVLFLGYTLYLWRIRRKYAHINGPPISNFYLGHLNEFRSTYQKNEFSHKLFLKWAQEYGPLYKVFILHKCMLIATGETVVKEILSNPKHGKSKQSYHRLFGVCGNRFLGQGLVTNTDTEDWHRRRVAINPAFHTRVLRRSLDSFNDVAEDWVRNLATVADGRTVVKMADMLCRITLDVIGKVAFSQDIGSVQDEESLFPSSMLSVLEAMSIEIRDPLMKFKSQYKSLVCGVKDAVEYLRGCGKQWIVERERAIADGENVPTDVLTYIIQSRENNQRLSLDDLLDDFDTLFIAGQETTSNCLAFLFCEVGRNPRVRNKLLQEIDNVVGQRTYVSWADLDKLQYMGQVLQETLRLYPPAPATARDIAEDVTIDGVLIPANSMAVVSLFAIHRLDENFPNPEQFYPERFADATSIRSQYTYMPFSQGHRSCLGRQFAQIEAKIILCRFLQHFEFTLIPEQCYDIQETTSLRPRGGALMYLRPRQT